MSLWLITLLAATIAALGRLLVPRRLEGRPPATSSPARQRTSTTQALVLLAEAFAWAVLAAAVAAVALSMMNVALPVHSLTALAAIGPLAVAMTAVVIYLLEPVRAEIRLERRIAKLTRDAANGALPPLPPSPEMQALIEPIASVNRDIASIEQQAGLGATSELADLHKMRDGLVELFVEKDLARRIDALRSEAPRRNPVCRPVGLLASMGAALLRDRLISILPAPAAAGLAVGLYAIVGLTAAWLSARTDITFLAQRVQSRAAEIVRVAEAPQPAAPRIGRAKRPPYIKAIRMANLAADILSDVSGTIDAAVVATTSRNIAAEQEIAALTLKLGETETKLARAEEALRGAKAEQLRLAAEAERTRDVDVATVAAEAQLERMAHEAAMAVEDERLHQKELELARRLSELEEAKGALFEEKQRLIALIEDKRRQAAAWESRVRLERMAATAEARAAERQARADETHERLRFEQARRRLDEVRTKSIMPPVSLADNEPVESVEKAYVPASAPAEEPADVIEGAAPVVLPGAWQVAAIAAGDTPLPIDVPSTPELSSSAADATATEAESTVAELAPLSMLAEQVCDRVRARARNLDPSASIGTQDRPAGKTKRDLEKIRALLECGQALMTAGELVAARLAFQEVADAGVAKGALALGTTFDPHALAKANLDGSGANTATARFWYKRALMLSGP